MSAAPVFHPAKLGDRISHDVQMATQTLASVGAALLGQALAVVGQAGVLAAQIGAGASSGGGKGTMAITEIIPRLATGVIEAVSPTVLLAQGVGAAIAQAAPVDCKTHFSKTIVPGASTVLVQGLPLALVGAQTECGAVLCDGALTIFVGGGPPAVLKGLGTLGGTKVADAIARAEELVGRVQNTIAAVQRGKELVEQTIVETVTKVETAVQTAKDTVQGAVSAVTGAITSITSGGVLGALAGLVLTPQAGSTDANDE